MSVRRNVIANMAGRLWSALMSFAFVPLYIKFLGIESYGLIGFFAALLGVFAVLDLGLGLTVNRELARMSGIEGLLADSRTLLRTLEVVYWTIAVVIGIVVIALAPLIASHWLNMRSLPVEDVCRAIQLMGVVIILRWPVALYTGALQGLRLQMRLNAIVALSATVASGGAALVLWWVIADIRWFFGWQIVATAVQVILLRSTAWRALALQGHQPAIRPAMLRATLGFSLGITGITLLSIVLTQLDKAILSRMLTLNDFGYYVLAGNVAGVLLVAGATVESATFPALARFHAAGDTEALSRLYHRSSHGLALLVIPLGITLILFAPELLQAYVHDAVVVERTHVLLSLLTLGNMILAVMFMPLSLQLACGWTRLSLYKNMIAVIFFIPALIVMVARYQAIGAALVWVALTGSYLIGEVLVMHRRLLPGEQWRWYGRDVGVTLLISLFVVSGARLAMPSGQPLVAIIVVIGTAWLVATSGAALMLPGALKMILTLLDRIRQR